MEHSVKDNTGHKGTRIMNIKSSFSLAGSLIFLASLSNSSFSAPGPCQGPNKNDPGCNDPPPPPPSAIVVNSATVDWFNEKITIRGNSLDTATDFILGGSVPITPLDVAASEVNLPFDTDVANAVTDKGNYQLNIDGTDVLSLFVKSQIIASDATGCPCEAAWNVQVGGQQAPECLQIVGNNSPDYADIAGTIYTDPTDPAVYPQFPIGASFNPNSPVDSVCRLVQVDGDGTVTELTTFRINEIQQEDCAFLLTNTYCATVVP